MGAANRGSAALATLIALLADHLMPRLDQSQQQPRPGMCILRPPPRRLVKSNRELVGFGQRVSRASRRHPLSVTLIDKCGTLRWGSSMSSSTDLPGRRPRQSLEAKVARNNRSVASRQPARPANEKGHGILRGGRIHTVRWQAGELIAVDHHDPDDEVSPASETVSCLQLLRTCVRRPYIPYTCSDRLRLGLQGRGRPDRAVRGSCTRAGW